MKKTKILTALILTLLLFATLSVTAFAADAEKTSGNYKYVVLEDGTIEISEYIGAQSTVNLPENIDGKIVSALGDELFRRVDTVKKVVVPDSVVTMGRTFYMSEVESIQLGKALKEIDKNAFYCSWSLKEILVPEDNQYFTSVNGILYNKAKTRLVCVPSGKEMATFTIPGGVKSIGSLAIRDVKIKELIIPSTVTKIEEYAITTKGVKSLIIPGSVEVIEENGIHFCSELKELKFEEGNLKEICQGAVSSCKDLEKLIIPSSVKSIGSLPGCDALKEYVIAKSNKNFSSQEGVLFNKNKTLLLDYAPGKTESFYAVPDTVTTITEWAFYGASKLKTLYLHDSVKKIGDYAYGYSGISKIYFEGTKSQYPRSKANSTWDAKVSYNCHLYSPVKNLKATQTIKTVTLSWDSVKGVEGYRVYKYNSDTKKYEYLKTTKETSLKISDLKAGTKYRFKVRAYIKADTTVYGPYSGVLATATRTKTPSITDIYSKTKGKAVVKWSNVSGETGFQLYYATSKNGDFKKVKSYEANKLAGSKTKLTSKKNYYFKVRAYTKTASGTVYSLWSDVRSVKIK